MPTKLDGWKEYELGQLLNYEQPSPYIVKSTNYSDTYSTPVLTAGKSFIIGYTDETVGIYNSLPVIIFDDFTTSSQYVNFPFKVKSSAMKILSPNVDLVLPKFIYYRMQIIQFDHSTHKRYWIQQYSKIKVQIPSIPEQERIVSKIEELFSRLDASVAELQTAKEKLKVYRQAVLKEAFDSVQVNSPKVTIKSVCDAIKVGIVVKPTQYYVSQGGVLAFRNANVRRNHIEDKDWAMISQEGHLRNLKSQVHKDDVLIARSGVNLGMAAAVPPKYDGYNAIDVVIAVPKKEFILPRYLAQYTNSPYGLEIVKRNQHGAAQGHLNVKEYGNLPIFLPDIQEQYHLLEKIESRLSVCDSIDQTIDASLQQAEALRQSILKQAFEGRLIDAF
ncbi:MAG: restriction endonuclease subunit S [Gemmiger sp.]|uniref:restriction endonuclease subunit S n=1 Tax=Gemmiger sp. TaxID=2049027 RepID=UPI002E785F6A|nr:restriction endonuclease subunit S [Gemmiger sp.]MEE0707427.1 restriction endonuclease subunit S [Gemmiger sp.]